MPAIEEIPEFIYQLGTKVNWTTEQQCFETFGQVLAGFYSSKLVNLHKVIIILFLILKILISTYS